MFVILCCCNLIFFFYKFSRCGGLLLCQYSHWIHVGTRSEVWERRDSWAARCVCNEVGGTSELVCCICCGGRKCFNFAHLECFSFLCATTTMLQEWGAELLRAIGSFKFDTNLPANKSTTWDYSTVSWNSGTRQEHAMCVSCGYDYTI